jgi:hypothetical protein
MPPKNEETRRARVAQGLASEVGKHSNSRVGRAGASRSKAHDQVQQVGLTGRADEVIE